MHVLSQVKVLENAKTAGFTEEQICPKYSVEGDSGLELYALEDQLIQPFEPTLIPHGVAIQVPEGFDTELRPRSSALLKHRVHVSLGTIDNPYRGELATCVLYVPQIMAISDEFLAEFGEVLMKEADEKAEENPFAKADILFTMMIQRVVAVTVAKMGLVRADMAPLEIKKGERVSQLVGAERVYLETEIVNELTQTLRGTNGWGHTGQKGQTNP